MNNEERRIIKSLNKLGVDTRYISLYQNTIYINNLKFSKFSRKREEEFHEEYPEIEVIRLKLFQKICIKVSRTIKNQIHPRDEIYISNDSTPENILLHILLEPYQRKYGITLTDNYSHGKIIANPKFLDEFASEYINLMISGRKITDSYEENTIYPLMHVHYEWINDWINSTKLEYTQSNYKTDEKVQGILNFLEKHIPNVNESIKQSVTYLDKNRID
ncbi:ATPase [Methanosphaera sp.]